MPIDVVCTGCRQKLRAKDSLAGKTVSCPKCGLKIHIAPPADEMPAVVVLPDAEPAPITQVVKTEEENEIFSPQSDDVENPEPPDPPEPRKKKTGTKKTGLNKKLGRNKKRATKDNHSNEGPLWLRHLHWLLVLALIPLAISLLQPRSHSLEERMRSTLEKMNPQQKALVKEELGDLDDLAEIAIWDEELYPLLPNHKIDGALLARDSKVQWVLALGSIVLFLGFFSILAMTGSAKWLHLLLVGQLTATVGIILLLVFQWIAGWTQFVWVRGSGIVVLLFWVVKGIGYSYQMALDPQFGFFESFLGFTFGVGLCEEMVKLLPVVVKVRENDNFTWHGAFLWGLASGAGFGIAEGIMYSTYYYNGIYGWDIYAVRFISCVALHALWTGSAAIMLYLFRNMLHGLDNWYDIFFPLLIVLAVPMLLHGLYDTLLKKNLEMWALWIAALSFVFLAALNSWLHYDELREADS